MKEITINKQHTFRYVAQNFTTGLTDLVVTVRKPDGSILSPNPTVTEIGESGNYDGVYEASFTPDALGIWQIKVSSASNGDFIVMSYQAVAYDVQDVKAQTQSIEDKVDIVDTVVDGIDTQLDTVEGKIDTVDTVVDGIDAQLDVVEGKIDTVDTVVDDIKNTVDNLPFHKGGYFA